MILLLTIVHVIICLVLILVILLQAGRGQGLSGPSFGSGNVQSLFGTGAGDFLTKATSVCAILFLFTSIGLGYMESRKSRTLMNFSKGQNAPIDVDAIKKALERVKQEAASEKTAGDAKTGEAVQAAADQALVANNAEVASQASTAVAEVTETAQAAAAPADAPSAA